MKVAISLLLGLHVVATSMQKPEVRVAGRQIKSLKDTALEKKLESIVSKGQLEQLLIKLPSDLRCDVLKKSMHNRHLSQINLLELIKEYCSDDALLRAYTYYTHITPETRQRNIFLMSALADHANIKGRSQTVHIINALILSAANPMSGFSPIHILIESRNNTTNTISVITQLLDMGEKPRAQDLAYAISQQENLIARLLIEHGVEVENAQADIIEQPLFQAFQTLNEWAIKTLLFNGASIQRLYHSSDEKKKITIPEYMRSYIQDVQRSGQPIEGQSQEQTNAYITQLKRLLNTYAPIKKSNRLSL